MKGGETKMRLYLLEREDGTYDEFDAKLIRAKSQRQARKIANESAGAEGEIWENKKRVDCTIITNKGAIGEIMASYAG